MCVIYVFATKTMLKHARNCANWFRRFRDVGSEVQRLRFWATL